MRIRVDYRTTYGYTEPATAIVQALRLCPHDHDSQHVRHGRVDVDVDGVMRPGVDAFGNQLHMFYAEGPATSLTIAVTGEADVTDTTGVIAGTAEPLPPAVFLRPTPLTMPDPAIVGIAEDARRSDALATLHSLTAVISGRMAFDVAATDSATTAVDALRVGSGVCQDFVHIFVAAARHLGFPARYVSGHLARDSDVAQGAAHAWAEALVPGLGWVAFDPTNGISTTDAYLRVAVGLDYLDAAPVRGARRGGGTEALSVTVTATDAVHQSQSQGQN